MDKPIRECLGQRKGFGLEKKTLKIGLFGLGTVGSGVVELLIKKGKRVGDNRFVLRKIVENDLSRKKGASISWKLVSSDPDWILNDPEIDTVIEVIGGIHPAQEIIMKSLEMGKNVVTANKALLARAGSEIFQKSVENGCYLGIRASHIASYRLIDSLISSPSQISTLQGVLNGTCNYLLTEMERKEEVFSVILKRAQAIGYVESDPSDDIDGYDTAHKLIVLLGLVSGTFLSLKSLYVEGIRRITLQDVKFARELGYRIKHLAIARMTGRVVEARVHPVLLPRGRGLARLEGVENGVELRDEMGLNISMQVPGAGKYPAATAILEDLICIAEDRKLLFLSEKEPLTLKRMEDIETKYYLRLNAFDQAGVLSKISGILGNHNISIQAVLQKGERKEGGYVPIILLTHKAREGNVQVALSEIGMLSAVQENPFLIRVEKETF